MGTSVMPLLGNITLGGSTDVTDVSWTAPTAVFGWPTMPLGTSLHTWPEMVKTGDDEVLAAQPD